MPPTADEYRAGVLQLLQQQRGSLTSLIEQVDGTLAYDWQRGMGAAASLYGPILDQYAKDLAALRAANDDPAARLTLDWLTSRNAQLASIQQSVAASAEKYGQTAAQTITHAQSAATDMAASDAAQLTQRSLWPAVEGAGVPPSVLFNRPNPDAVAQWVGRAGNGHPLGDLFQGFGAEATQGARQAMMLGLLTGANPKAMASGIANALGISRSRATIISRTEVLGSYRSAAHETYRANSDVLDGWIWSAGGANPCAMCMGMDGLTFSLSEELVDHPCGKCAPIPVTKSWSDILGPLGIDTSDLEETSMGAEGAYETGPEKFARMPPEQQRAIIGTKTGYEAYQRGEVELKDFIGTRPAEGGFPAMPYQKSLREMEIPTGRAGSPLVEQSPRLRELERAGQLRARDFGAKIEPDQMPAWAQKSYASQAVYQIMRNGLPWNMAGQELPLLSVNIEQMLTEDLSLNVRMAALRLQDMLKQYDTYLERYVRNVTSGASTLGRAPEFVYKPSKELERALSAARAGERATLEAAQTGARVAEDVIGRAYAPARATVSDAEAAARAEVKAARSQVNSLNRKLSKALETGKPTEQFTADIAKAKNALEMAQAKLDAQVAIRKSAEAEVKAVAKAQAAAERAAAREAAKAAKLAEKQAAKDAATAGKLGAVRPIETRAITNPYNLELRDAKAVQQEQRELLKTLSPTGKGAESIAKAETRIARELTARLKGNADFQQLAPLLRDRLGQIVKDTRGITAEAKQREIDHIASMFTDKGIVQALMGEWARQYTPLWASLQEAIGSEFGLTTARDALASPIGKSAMKMADKYLADLQPGLRALVREMYNNTQEYLAKEGITEVPVYRGLAFNKLPDGVTWKALKDNYQVISIRMNPASSFSLDAEKASTFATGGRYQVVLAARVPASDILSIPLTGAGVRDEAEVIVLGSQQDVWAIGRSGAATMTRDDVQNLLTTAHADQAAADDLARAVSRATVGTDFAEASYDLTPADQQFVADLRQQVDALDQSALSHGDVANIGAQLHDYIQQDAALNDYHDYAVEARAIRTKGPANVTDAERAWAMGKPDAVAAHGGVTYFQAEARYQAEFQARVLAHLQEMRAMGGTPIAFDLGAPDFSLDASRAVAQAKDLIPADWIAASNDLGKLSVVVNDDASAAGYFEAAANGRGTIGLTLPPNLREAQQMQSLGLHEMMHRMEQVIPRISQLESEFYNARTVGEELVSLKPLNGVDAMTKVDQFIDPYVGRAPLIMRRPDYDSPLGFPRGSVESYEILSVGAEALLGGSATYDTIALREDEGFVNFILGLLSTIRAEAPGALPEVLP